jgi:serine phosphatase RsbU (regulator of sigma subunit)
MLKFITISLAKRLRPDFDDLPKSDRNQLLLELSGVIFYIPWLVLGFAWLFNLTDPKIINNNWSFMVLIVILSMTLNLLPFFMVITTSGDSSSNSSNLTDIILISAIFILGPTGVWLIVLSSLGHYAYQYVVNLRSAPITTFQSWNWLRNFVFNLGVWVFAILCGLWVYTTGGGGFPLSGSNTLEPLLAMLALLVYWLIIGVLMVAWWVLVFRSNLMMESVSTDSPMADQEKADSAQLIMVRRSLIFLILTSLPGVFGILGALLYTHLGLWPYLFFYLAVLLVSLLARRLSTAVLSSQQKSDQLDQLERLGRAIIAAPADASTLPSILKQYVPGMVTYHQIEIRLFEGAKAKDSNIPSDQIKLLQLPQERGSLDQSFWDYFIHNPTTQVFDSGEKLPWSKTRSPHRHLLIPIKSEQSQEPIGGICLVQEKSLFVNIDIDLTPAIQVLSAQIASALHAAQVFERTLEYQKTSQELSFAGKIQTSFLPRQIPEIHGWHISTLLDSARETYGDFFDLIELPDDRIGIIIADVTDKGMGAALFMALCRTLLRTYALEYPDDPARVMAAVNTRILMDAETGLFVTVFYGVLNTITGELIYVNAGHNPPFWLRSGLTTPGGALKRTGMAIGVMEDEVWDNRRHQIEPDDILVLYTDGIPDAQNPVGAFYGEERFTKIAMDNSDRSAYEIKDAVMGDLEKFVSHAPQADDITLLVLKRQHNNG